MGVDMVDAEAVIALAAGAVAEVQIGEIRVRAAADLSFAGVGLRLLLILDPAHLLLEVHGVLPLLPAGGL